MSAPEFKNATVVGESLFNFISWAKQSLQPDSAAMSLPDMPLLLPPVQRSAVWNVKKITDLWDSVLRGLPIGMFYLLTRPCDTKAMDLDGNLVTAAAGFDLLDGQQRLRALLLGWTNIFDDRCLWIDLAPDKAPKGSDFRLFITSKTQPFGYDPDTGRKWLTHDRREARAKIEPAGHPISVRVERGEKRPAYDSELFSGIVYQDCKAIAQPPKPYKASRFTFKLHSLLSAWEGGGLDALTKAASGASGEAIDALNKAFCRLKKTQVALLKVDLGSLGDDAVLALFERIGAGGEPLSNDERLYSIYKHRFPKIRGVVEAISTKAGKIMPPTKIVTTALRIANAKKRQPSYSIPDVALFAREMRAEKSELRSELEKLLTSGSPGQLQHGFEAVKNILSYWGGAGPFWLPDVMLATLPSGVWQVLVFWACSVPIGSDLSESRQEAVRFALYWRLCIWNDEQATVRCFEYLATKQDKIFPATALYKILNARDNKIADELIPASTFAAHFAKQPSPLVWRTDEERFGSKANRNEMCARWWWNGKFILPWLQRDYLKKEFPGYAPLSDHEDDIPYDIDHICPQNDWGDDKRNFEKRLDCKEIDPRMCERLFKVRREVGNGIGNLRLVGTTENRSNGDADVGKKMDFILKEIEGHEIERPAGPPGTYDVALWEKVSRKGKVSDRRWNKERLLAFEQAVEGRAVYLYQRFHDDLGFSAWTSPD